MDVPGPGGRVVAILAFWSALALATWVSSERRARGGRNLGFGGSVAVPFVAIGLINAAVYAGARRLRRESR